jgi:hypothetical protein
MGVSRLVKLFNSERRELDIHGVYLELFLEACEFSNFVFANNFQKYLDLSPPPLGQGMMLNER